MAALPHFLVRIAHDGAMAVLLGGTVAVALDVAPYRAADLLVPRDTTG